MRQPKKNIQKLKKFKIRRRLMAVLKLRGVKVARFVVRLRGLPGCPVVIPAGEGAREMRYGMIRCHVGRGVGGISIGFGV
jgi:uncharacterized membrane protein